MFLWQIPEISRDRFKAAPVMKMFGAPFLNKPLRSPMDFKCHSFHSLPHLGSCSILSYLAFFWPFSLSANTQKSTHSCRHTLSHNSVWLKFRMLPFFKVCVSVYEWVLYESKQVHATSMQVEIRDNFSRDASLSTLLRKGPSYFCCCPPYTRQIFLSLSHFLPKMHTTMSSLFVDYRDQTQVFSLLCLEVLPMEPSPWH